MNLLHGDCLEVMRTFETNSFDSIVTDPPYGLGFMGKAWDHGVPGVPFWEEMLRILKPGGHLLAFSGSRTYHRMACAIEDAGWEIRDQIMWLYGSGFPKSHNGVHGGTALKPAHEPICVARKPLVGTVAATHALHGTGGLNIDACRVGSDGGTSKEGMGAGEVSQNAYGDGLNTRRFGQPVAGLGRWPANVIHDGSDEVLAAFPDAPGQLANASTNNALLKTQSVYGAMKRGRADEPSADSDNEGALGFKMKPGARRVDSGSAARFFYCAKASKADRESGCEDLTPDTTSDGSAVAADNAYQRGKTARLNTHPTVKPTDLMRYLCRLVTPAGGHILDPFMGSGSTGRGAVLEGFQFTGIDQEATYVDIAVRRITQALLSA